MPIQEDVFRREENHALWLFARRSLAEALVALEETGFKPNAHLVVELDDGRFAARRFDDLAADLFEQGISVDTFHQPLNHWAGTIIPLVNSQDLEQTDLAFEDVEAHAYESPGELLVITAGKYYRGIIYAGSMLGSGPLHPTRSTTGALLAQFKHIDPGMYRMLSTPRQSMMDETHHEDQDTAYVNTGFAHPDQPDTPLNKDHSLLTGTNYYFWLQVGELIAGAIDQDPTEIPLDELPQEAHLQVVLFDFEGELTVQEDAAAGDLKIQKDGRIIVIRQPGGKDGPPQNSHLLEKRLFFPIHTPIKPGSQRLRCNIYCQQVLVQSHLVHVLVSETPSEISGALITQIDYSLDRKLNAHNLFDFPPHSLSLMLNDNGNGTHDFRFVGAENFRHGARLTEGELSHMVQLGRGALRRAAWGDKEEWRSGKKYRYDKKPSLKQLKEDLYLLAVSGHNFYRPLTRRLTNNHDQARKLEKLMRQPGLVQIAFKESPGQLIPAALIYDYPLTGTAAPQDVSLCPEFMKAYENGEPLEECACFGGSCPSAGDRMVVCPSGFWGFRHYLGLPLSMGGAQDQPGLIEYSDDVNFTISVTTDPAFTKRKQHEKTLKTLHTDLAWHRADTLNETFDVFRSTNPHIVYFFCHGGITPSEIPYIRVGPVNSPGFVHTDLYDEVIRWEDTRPLVFINGCHTTALEPDRAIDFVSAFIQDAAASGVIGTEITIFESLAVRFGEAFMARFINQGQSVGEAVRNARLALLQEGNPLGLVYIPFALASLQLIPNGGSP